MVILSNEMFTGLHTPHFTLHTTDSARKLQNLVQQKHNDSLQSCTLLAFKMSSSDSADIETYMLGMYEMHNVRNMQYATL